MVPLSGTRAEAATSEAAVVHSCVLGTKSPRIITTDIFLPHIAVSGTSDSAPYQCSLKRKTTID